MNIEDVKEKVKNSLSEKRYNHSIGAMKEAGELAKIYGENQEEARIAGLLHDIAKESIKITEKNEIFNFLNKHDMPADEIEKDNIGLLHAKMGAIIAKEEFGVSKKVQNAIKYHTTGNVNMDLFAKIIYLADKIEENRCYDGVDEIRELAKKRRNWSSSTYYFRLYNKKVYW